MQLINILAFTVLLGGSALASPVADVILEPSSTTNTTTVSPTSISEIQINGCGNNHTQYCCDTDSGNSNTICNESGTNRIS